LQESLEKPQLDVRALVPVSLVLQQIFATVGT